MGNQAQARWPGLKHMWANEKAVRALHVQFVPNRMLVDKHGNIVKWWNGENGKVVDYRRRKEHIQMNNGTGWDPGEHFEINNLFGLKIDKIIT